MKKVFVLFAAIYLMLCGCSEKDPQTDPDNFIIEVTSCDGKNAAYTVINNSKNTVEIGNDYYLEYKEDTEWLPVEETGEVFFSMIAYGLNPGEGKSFSEDLEMRYGILPEGIYRIGKDIWIWNEDEVVCGEQRVFAEFEIK